MELSLLRPDRPPELGPSISSQRPQPTSRCEPGAKPKPTCEPQKS